MDKKTLTMASMWLVVIGGLNWGLVGLLDMNLVDSLLGEGSMLAKLVYILVGLSAVMGVLEMVGKKK